MKTTFAIALSLASAAALHEFADREHAETGCVAPGTCTPPAAEHARVIVGPKPGLQWNINGGFCGAFSVQQCALAHGAWISQDLVRKANAAGKFCITATQMMESMIENKVPTRAEVRHAPPEPHPTARSRNPTNPDPTVTPRPDAGAGAGAHRAPGSPPQVSDVANAIFDGTDAVMLSGESAMGVDPCNVVQWMGKVIAEAEAHAADVAPSF